MGEYVHSMWPVGLHQGSWPSRVWLRVAKWKIKNRVSKVRAKFIEKATKAVLGNTLTAGTKEHLWLDFCLCFLPTATPLINSA